MKFAAAGDAAFANEPPRRRWLPLQRRRGGGSGVSSVRSWTSDAHSSKRERTRERIRSVRWPSVERTTYITSEWLSRSLTVVRRFSTFARNQFYLVPFGLLFENSENPKEGKGPHGSVPSSPRSQAHNSRLFTNSRPSTLMF